MKFMTLSNKAKHKGRVALLAGFLTVTGGCQDFLAVNTNPNGPETVAANTYLPPMPHWIVSGSQWGGRYVGLYIQPLVSVLAVGARTSWGRLWYDPRGG